MRGTAVIGGIGMTAQGKLPDRSTTSMNVEASRKALADAGIDKDLVDGLFVKYPTSQHRSMYAQTMAEALGIQPRIGGVWDQGGATNISMVSFAAMAIEHGQCEVALVTIADNPKTGTRQAYERGWGDDAVHGWFGVAAGYGMIMRRHMEEFGTTAEQFGAIARACRRHGAANPDAQLRLPLTEEMYDSSRLVVDPLRRDDICLVSDGGAAVVVMSAARARELGVPAPVPILGFGQGQTSWEVPQRPVLTSTAAEVSARAAFAMAGLYDWASTSFAEEAESLRLFYADPTGMKYPNETCRVSAAAAHDVTGRVAYSGAAWVRPDYRGRSLPLVLPRLAKAYAYTRWRPDFIVSWMTEATYKRGLVDHVGYTTVDWDVQLRNSFTGDLRFAFLSMRQRCLLDYVRDFSTSMAQVDRRIGERRA